MAVKSHDPKKVAIIVGSRPLAGFANGTFIEIERVEDSWELMVGADGEAVRSKNGNLAGKFKVTLMQSSASNDYLTSLQVADELTGDATFPVLVKDNRGGSIYTAATAWITKPAPAAFAKSPGTREWVIETDELIPITAGSN